MSGTGRILILSYHFYPSPEVGAKRTSELACRLRDEGWDVTVVAAPGRVVPELAARIGGVKVITVAPPPKLYPLLARGPKRLWRAMNALPGDSRRQGPAAQVSAGFAAAARRESPLAWLKRNYHALELLVDDRKLWSLRVLLRALLLRRRFDWILTSGPFHSVHLAARALAALTGARWAMDLRDPWVGDNDWPERRISASLSRDRTERWLERLCVRAATCVTVASPGIGARLCERIPRAASKVHVVLNGYDGEARVPASPAGRLRLLYAGSLYLNRDPFPLLEALRALVELPMVERTCVSFTLVGRCERWNGRDVAAWVAEAGMGDVVRVVSPVSPAQAAAMMDEVEVLVNFAQGQREQIPAKFYDYIASGREMLLIAESDADAARLTRESGAGRVVEPADEGAMVRVLNELYAHYVVESRGFAPDREVIARYSREHQNRRFLALLTGGDPAAAGGRGRGRGDAHTDERHAGDAARTTLPPLRCHDYRQAFALGGRTF